MLEKIFIKQKRWEMTKWMKKNSEMFPEDYSSFRIFLFLNYIGVVIGLLGVVFMILFLTGLYFNFYTLILWLTFFIGGMMVAILGNRLQLPFLYKYLHHYVKDKSISVDFNISEWIYLKKYISLKAYKYGILSSIIAYFPLSLLFIFSLGLFLDVMIVFMIGYLLMGLLLLTNLPILYVNSNSFYYSAYNEPLITLYGFFFSFSLTITFKNGYFWFLGGMIMGIYWLVFLGIWRKLISIAENDVQQSLVSDISNYLMNEKEIDLKYWKWLQSRKYLILDLIESGKFESVDLNDNKIIRKD